MPALAFYYWVAAKGQRSLTLIIALAAAWVGDILLMLAEKEELYFIPGLIAFLVMHVLLLLTFRQHRRENDGNPLRGVQNVRMAFPIVLAGTGLIVVLYPSLGPLQLPVTAYAIVLIIMVLSALYRYGYSSFKSMILTFAGALLFMISDSVLAINKFLMPVSDAGMWIMFTYIGGQFLIVEGISAHDK